MILTLRPIALGIACLVVGCSSLDRPRPRALPAGVSFAGTWESTWGKMVLRQDGKHVHGTFTGYREGGLSGSLDGDVWHFVWDQLRPRTHGHGFLQITPDGQHLEGRWGYVKADADGGRWAADRESDTFLPSN
jgi:hypothetical protein